MARKIPRPADPPLEPEVHQHRPANTNLIPFKPGNRMAIGQRKGKIGRPPSIVRAASRMGFYSRIPMLKRIADGVEMRSATISKRDKDGNVSLVEIQVPPTIQERLKALDLLGKYGGLVVVREDEEEQDQLDEELDAMQGFDFSLLDDTQLEMLHSLLAASKKALPSPEE